ncbi:MAG: hypothetical protein QN203_09170 [Armatimonadota bacterium]|nr:hypothetical protein [Armatimonadota bacterium]MDR7533674.1 hypothetical protein [Armatimonadota bacterium]
MARLDDFEGTRAYFIERTNEWTTPQGQRRSSRDVQIRDLEWNYIGRLNEQRHPVFRRKMAYMR